MPGINLKSPISGIIDSASSGIKNVTEIFKPNAEASAQRDADEQMALMRTYQAEFNARSNRTWADSIADAVNRLVRPVITITILSIFFVAYLNPERFAIITTALGSVPDGYWALLSVIIAFYFGGRMQLKSQDFQFKESQAKAVKALIETKKEFRKLEMDNDEPDRVVGDTLAKDDSMEVARRQQDNMVVDRFLQLSEDATEEEKAEKLKKEIVSIRNESITNTRMKRRVGHAKRRR